MTSTLRSPRVHLLLAGGLLATGVGLAALAGGPSRASLQDAFVGSGLLGAVVFAVVYAVLTVALLPGSVLAIGLYH